MRILKAVTEIIDNANDRNINRFYPESARKKWPEDMDNSKYPGQTGHSEAV